MGISKPKNPRPAPKTKSRRTSKTTTSTSQQYSFDDLVGIMQRLRAPDGCPWDRKQNHRSLLPYLLEETYEVMESIQRRNMADLAEELGDLLLQIVFHAQLASERDKFKIDDVISGICRKLIDRHPHVFDKKRKLSSDQVLGNWEKLKLKETGRNGQKKGVLDGLPKTLPSLLSAFRIQEKTSRFGFDWDRPEDVLDKVEEESDELRRSLRGKRRTEMEHEIGDLLFALVNLSRHLKIDPETALAKTNRRFAQRFQYIERQLAARGRTLTDATLEEMDGLWDEAKKKLG